MTFSGLFIINFEHISQVSQISNVCYYLVSKQLGFLPQTYLEPDQSLLHVPEIGVLKCIPFIQNLHKNTKLFY